VSKNGAANVDQSDDDMEMTGGAKSRSNSKTQGTKKTTQSKSAKTSAGSKTSKSSKPASKSTAGRGRKSTGTKNAKGNSRTANKDKKNDRYFKLIDAKTGRSYGRYTGDTPKQAASKGFTKMLQKLKVGGKTAPKQSTIFLRESTRGSARKIYGYEASRLKLPEPQELIITDKISGEEKTITYHFRNKIKKVPVPEQIGGAKTSRATKKNAGSKKTAGSKKGTTKTSNKTSSKTSKAATPAKGKKTEATSAGSKKGTKGKPAPAKSGTGKKVAQGSKSTTGTAKKAPAAKATSSR